MYNKEVADRAVAFFNRLLVHTKGEFADRPFALEPWQEHEIIRPLFGTLDARGMRQYRTAFVGLPRKTGKSTLAAGIALYLLVADHEEGAEIYGAAADRDQASIVFNVADEMVRRSPKLSKLIQRIPSRKRLIVPSTASFYEAIASDEATAHGFNAAGVVFDELHVQPNRNLWDVLTTAQGARRQPLVFAITTAGYDQKSICYEQYDYAKRVLSGSVTDPTFFAFIREAAIDADWRDETVWHQANPALGVFRSLDEMRVMAHKASEVPALQNTFRRLYLNQWTSQESRWLDMATWDACAVPVDEAGLRGRTCYGGLDLSSSIDLSALVLAFPDGDGSLDILAHFWLPEMNLEERIRRDRVRYDLWAGAGLITLTPGNVIDHGAIREYVTQAATRYDIREIGYDPYNAVQLALGLADDLGAETMVPIRQGYLSLSPPTKELQKRVLARTIRHGGNPVLRWNAENVMVTTDPAQNIKPDKAKSTQRIDGVVALIMALDRAMRNEADSRGYDHELVVLG